KDSFRFRWAVAAPGGRTGQGESVGLTRGGRTDDPRRKFFSMDLARQSRSPACAGFAGGLEDQGGNPTDWGGRTGAGPAVSSRPIILITGLRICNRTVVDLPARCAAHLQRTICHAEPGGCALQIALFFFERNPFGYLAGGAFDLLEIQARHDSQADSAL